MHFTTFIASVLAGSASAAVVRQAQPPPPPADGTPFNLIALRSASDIHFTHFGATHSGIFLGLKEQAASCDKGPATEATFYLEDGNMFLYAASATPQQLYVDTVLGGRVAYTTGAQPTPPGGERGPWKLDEAGDLSFNGNDLLACPQGTDGAWAVYAGEGQGEGCLGFSARAAPVQDPNGCLYSSNRA
ncbi:uncharacterized protein E0L32_002313 [Thyridium curvatum]|uniref:Cell wall protein PhiA n=1 Tax=Thyridium curvatum TaxID=1093900 RepID=A0A507AJ78_9PEZI|nr:uncharacterized protein E0L32_002313 [Thyridium curvatum]TPX06817.1 hypothetical protein E0L32_002313 [Thyridium curvatum]